MADQSGKTALKRGTVGGCETFVNRTKEPRNDLSEEPLPEPGSWRSVRWKRLAPVMD
jgi:hypothetical protein